MTVLKYVGKHTRGVKVVLSGVTHVFEPGDTADVSAEDADLFKDRDDFEIVSTPVSKPAKDKD